jgi:hypothetical protein
MAGVTLYNATRMLAIENGTIVNGLINSFGRLILTKHDGSTIDAGIVYPIDATPTVKGLVQLATSAEVITGTDTTKVVTPAQLATLTPLETRNGLARIATLAEVIAGVDDTKFVTAYKLAQQLATTTGKGLVQLATSSEATIGTDAVKAITPATATTMITPVSARVTVLENQVKKAVSPSSIVIAGSGSSASIDSFQIITFTAVTSISLNDIFDGLGLDMYEGDFTCVSSVDLVNIFARFRTSAGVDLSAASSYGALYYGSVSAVASSGGTTSATLAQMYFAYGRNQSLGMNTFAKIDVIKPRSSGFKSLLTRAYGPNYVDYTMGNHTTDLNPYSGLTIFPSSGTITGSMRFWKK